MSKDKVKKFGQLAYEYIRKKLIKPGKGGITSLPTDKEITNEMLVMFENLREAGYNVTNIGKEVKNADDLKFLVNRIEQAKINQAKEFSDAAEALDTIQFKLNNNIPLNPDDQKKLLGKGFKTTTEAFQGFKPKIIQGGKKEGIKSLDLAKELEELTNKNLKERGLGEIKLGDKLPEPKKKKPAVDPELQKSEDTKKMIKDFEERNERALEDVVDDAGGTKEGVEFDDEPFDAAKGGIARVGMFKGGKLFKFLSENSPLQAYKKYLKSVKKRAQKDDIGLVPEMLALSSAGILGNRALQRKLKSMGPREEEEKDKKAMGGRIGFEKGGMTRRTFLKLLGGLASIPLVGKFLKPAAKVAKTAEVAKSSGVPAYFPKLVEKIKLLGDDITPIAATQERQAVTKYKDFRMTEDLTTGAIEIEKTNTGMAMAGDEVYEGIASKELIEYTPPETIIGKDGKPVKVPAQYEETTARPTNMEGDFEDFDDGLESIDEILEEVRMKKSGGGLAYMMGE